MKLKNKLKNRILRSIRLAALTGAVSMFSAVAFAAVANDALPTGGQFMGTGHGGTIMSSNGVMSVNQSTATAAIKWQTFNVGANATVNFNFNNKQDGHYTVLNYSTNLNKASEIYGRMKAGADAHVWLINPNGVIIGKGAQIDVGHMHMATHKLSDDDLIAAAGAGDETRSACKVINDTILTSNNHSADAQLMSMGNMYVNSISFDGDRVVLDADKLYTYAGDKVELGEKGKLGEADDMVHKVDAGGDITDTLVDRVYMGENGSLKDITGTAVANNTGSYARAAANAAGHTWTGDALNTDAEAGDAYITIGKHAKEVVVGYSVYDANETGAKGKGTYENSANWRAFYTTLEGKAKSERVGFAWVEDSKQLEKIGEGVKTLGRDFALKDGIAAVNTKEMDGGKGFTPIGKDPNVTGNHAFTGKFDGLDYDIYGLTINRPDENDIGMFGHVGDGAVIRNVNLVSGAIVGQNNVGGVVGHAQADTKGITIEDVANSARVLGINNVGGIVGKAEGASANAEVNIIDAENVALVRGNVNVGGIAGEMTHTNITGETYNTGAVRSIENYKNSPNNKDNAYKTRTAAELTEDIYTYGFSPDKYNITEGDKIDVIQENWGNQNNPEKLTITKVERNGVVVTNLSMKELIPGDVLFGDVSASKIPCKYTLNADGTFTMVNLSNGKDCGKKHLVVTQYAGVLVQGSKSDTAGGIVGKATNSYIGNAETNAFQIYNEAAIKAGYNVGGIVGHAQNVNIVNVSNKGDITANGYIADDYKYGRNQDTKGTNDPLAIQTISGVYQANAGGIAGSVASSTISNALNEGDVKTSQDEYTQNGNKYNYYISGNIGGVVGKVTNNTTISDVENKENNVAGAHNVGGIAGYVEDSKVIRAINNGGDITATGARVSTGFQYEAVRGDVKPSSANDTSKIAETGFIGNVGGIAGYLFGNKAQVGDSRNRGNVHSQEISSTITNVSNIPFSSRAANVGGIVGKLVVPDYKTFYYKDTDAVNYNTSNPTIIESIKVGMDTVQQTNIYGSANTGKVTGYAGIGGVVGQMYNGAVASSYNMGNVTTAYADYSGSTAANMGGVLGDGIEVMSCWNDPSRTYMREILFNVYNEGMIGNDTYNPGNPSNYNSNPPKYEFYGRNVGGVAGRLQGYLSHSYNKGAMYDATDTVGGVVGLAPLLEIKDVYNTGNITVINNKNAGNQSSVGGIVGTAGVKLSIENAYNLGVIRSITYMNSPVNYVGGIIGDLNNKVLTLKNVYSTGEVYGGVYSDGAMNEPTGRNNVGAIIGGRYTDSKVTKSNVYYIQAPDEFDHPTNFNTNGVTDTISYADRLNAASYDSSIVANVSNAPGSLALDNKPFRIYDGVTMPILNAFLPNVASSGAGNTEYLTSAMGVKNVQYGTEYDPIMTFITLNSSTPALNFDFTASKVAGRGGIAVLNGGMNITNYSNANFNGSDYYSGTVYTKGDLTFKSNGNDIKWASDARVIGSSIDIDTVGTDGNYGDVVAFGLMQATAESASSATGTVKRGDISIKAGNIDVSASLDAATEHGEMTVTGMNNTANASAVMNYTATNSDGLVNYKNPGAPLTDKAEKYHKVIVAPADTNGNISINGTGDVNIAFGRDERGLMATEGNLSITGKNVFIDSDLKVGVNSKKSIITLTGDSVILDISNVGASSAEADVTTRINKFVDDFSGVSGYNNKIVMKNAMGQSIGTEAKIIVDMYTGNVLDPSKFDKAGETVLLDKLAGMKAFNGPLNTDESKNEKVKSFVWVANADQLKDIQAKSIITELNNIIDSTTATQTEKDVAKAKRDHLLTVNYLDINYALKNSIDASDLIGFESIGFNGVGNDGTAYTGIFDGRGNDLNSLSPNGSTGLFDTIGAGGVVKNLYINASRLTGDTSRVGLVAGTNKGVIENVNTFGNTIKDKDNEIKTPVFVGGLVGLNETTGVIVNSKSEDIVYSDSTKFQVDVGGLAGMNAGIIYSSTGKSDVSVADGSATSLGGIVGVNVGFLKDVNTVGVTSGLYDYLNDTYIGAGNVGGIAGENRTVYLTKDTNQTKGALTDSNTYTVVHNNGKLQFKLNNTVIGTATADDNQKAVDATGRGGTISDAYNDSHVKGWSNTGGIVGRNFGEGNKTHYGDLTNGKAGQMYYVANAGDVIAGDNVGGLAGVNDGLIRIAGVTNHVVNGMGYTIDDGSEAQFIADYLTGAKSQIIFGRNSGMITGVYGYEEYLTDAEKTAHKAPDFTSGTNVGGLIGRSEAQGDVENLVNGKAASVYGFMNVGGLIGENLGVLQNSINMMENNEISGVINVGGTVGENAAGGVIYGIINETKFNITVNDDYFKDGEFTTKVKDLSNLDDSSAKNDNGTQNLTGVKFTVSDGNTKLTVQKQNASGAVITGTAVSYVGAEYFGGVLGHNAKDGIVADAENYANVDVTGGKYVGGIMGRNEGKLVEKGKAVNLTKRTVVPASEANAKAADSYYVAKGQYINHGVVGGSVKIENTTATGAVDETKTVWTTNTDSGVITKTEKNASGETLRTTTYTPGTSEYVGGIIGLNNSNLQNVDMINHATAVVMGKNYVGGIVGENTGSIKGDRDANSNYYEDLIYNNGKISATGNFVGGIVGKNSGANADITLAYNTGSVFGKNYVGGIAGDVASGAKISQVFSSLATGDVIQGESNVGGIVGKNAGAISDSYSIGEVHGTTTTAIGNLVGNNVGEVEYSYSTATSGKLIGAGIKGGAGTYSFVAGDSGESGTAAGEITSVDAQKKGDSYVNYKNRVDDKGNKIWKFYDGLTTPILKNFLTNVYYSGAIKDFEYAAKKQGVKVVAADTNNDKILDAVIVIGTADSKEIGRIYAVDPSGTHNMTDFLGTYGAGNGSKTTVNNVKYYDRVTGEEHEAYALDLDHDLIRGNDQALNVGDYTMFSSQQIKPVTNQLTDSGLGVNNLGYNFVVIENNPTNSDPFSPQLPPPPIAKDKDGKLIEEVRFNITPAILTVTGSSVNRTYGNAIPTMIGGTAYTSGDIYNINISGWKGDENFSSSIAKENQEDIKASDEAVSGLDSGKTTNNAGKYQWDADVKLIGSDGNYLDEGLKNYVLAVVGPDGKPVVQGEGKTVNVVADSIVDRATLNINYNSFTVVYGTDKADGYIFDTVNKKVSDVAADKVSEKEKYSTSGLVNNDDITKVMPNLKTVDEAFNGNKTNDVGHYAIYADSNNTNSILKTETIEHDDHGHVIGGVSNDGNYDVKINHGYVDVIAKKLEVTYKDVSRDYGTDKIGTNKNEYINTISGFVTGEEGNAADVIFNRTSDGAVDLPSDHKAGMVTNNVGTYDWTGTLKLNDSSLKNYTFGNEGEARVTELGADTVKGKSTVNKQNITLTLNDLHMIYGATVGTGSLTTNEHYGDAGLTVYEANVNKAYTFAATGDTKTWNGDTINDIIDANKVAWENTGFFDHTDGTKHTNDVNTTGSGNSNKYYLNANTTSATGVSAGNYNITLKNGNGTDAAGTTVQGNVVVEYALLSAGAKDIYRYYGNADDVYHYNSVTKALDLITDGSTYGHGELGGWKYEEGDNTTNGVKWNSILKIDKGTVKDGAVTDLAPNTTTNAVKEAGYTWSDGQLRIDTADTAVQNAVFKNYRFWDNDNDKTSMATTIKDGAKSYILPQLIEVTLADQTITYGDKIGDALKAYTGTDKNAKVSVTSGEFVNNDSKELADYLTITSFGYNKGDDKAYVEITGDGKTNNVGKYENSIGMTSNIAQNGGKIDSAYVTESYNTFNGNANYKVVVKQGTVKIDPKAITASDLFSQINYGEVDRKEYNQLHVTGGVLNADDKVYNDHVSLAITTGSIENGKGQKYGEGYKDNRNGRNTADVDTYVDALLANVKLEGAQAGNYKLVDSQGNEISQLKGKLEVTPVELTVSMNDFKVLYGDIQDVNNSINDEGVRTNKKITEEEATLKALHGLANGDKIEDVMQVTAVNDKAFVDRTVNGKTVQGTADVKNGYNLGLKSADGLTVDTSDANGVRTGTTKNYKVTIVDGKVDVLPKKVEVLEPGKPVPPNDDTKVYVYAKDVERTYGDTEITNKDVNNGNYVVGVSGLAPWEENNGSKDIIIKKDHAADQGIVADADENQITNNAGNSYKWTTSPDALKDAQDGIKGLGGNYDGAVLDTKTILGNSIVKRAQLVIQMSGKEGIVYGAKANSIKFADAEATKSATAGGTTYTSTYDTANGLAAQDKDLTWDKLFQITGDENTGYNGEVGRDIYDAAGKKIDYAHNAKTTDKLENAKVNSVSNGRYGEKITTGNTQNYDVTIVSGTVNFKERKIDTIDPEKPMTFPNPLDPDNPIVYDPKNPDDPRYPVYDPTNEEDPRNKIIVTGTTVERTYGDTDIKKGEYGVQDYVGGAPAWFTPEQTKELIDSIKVSVNPVTGDDGVVAANKTNNVGDYNWKGEASTTNKNFSAGPIVGNSIVSKAELVVQIGNTSTIYGTPFDEKTYGFNLNGVVNGDSYDELKGDVDGQKGGYINNQAFDGTNGKWTGNAGHHEDDLLFINMNSIELKNYNVKVLPGDVDISKATIHVVIPDPNDPTKPIIPDYIDPKHPDHLLDPNDPDKRLPNGDNPDFKIDPKDPYNKVVDPNGNSYGIGNLPNDPNINYIIVPFPKVDEEEILIEDIYPWLHRTNNDHGWGHQEHWRERKAEVKFTIGGADFFNDLAKAEAQDDEEVKES